MAKIAAKYKVGVGADQYVRHMAELAAESDDILKQSIYVGAGIVADEIRRGIAALPTVKSNAWGTPDKPIRGITVAQKMGLLDGLGIAHMDAENGVWNTKVGMDGYNIVQTKRWPDGQPNAMVLRSVESGTSFMRKIPVVARSTAKSRPEAEKAMGERLDELIAEKFGK